MKTKIFPAKTEKAHAPLPHLIPSKTHLMFSWIVKNIKWVRCTKQHYADKGP
jgi:hypothetical protein